MSKTGICMGCFSAWEEADGKCRFCGYDPAEEKQEIAGLKTGDVLGKRYLLGSIYHESEEYVIWRIFDNVTRIACFMLYSKGENEKDDDVVSLISGRMQVLKKEEKHEIVLLAVKMVKGKKRMIFSLKDRYMNPDDFVSKLKLESMFMEEEKAFLEEEILIEEAETDQDKVADEKEESATAKEGISAILEKGCILEGHYSILDCIGIGGFGITYLANDRFTGRCVAIKEYFPMQWAEREDSYVNVKSSKLLASYRYGMESFLKEIRMTAGYIHEKGIVTIYDGFYENDTIYMVMEYLSGISVGRELKKREYQPYSLEEVRDIVLPVMDALDTLHGNRLIHSDISPGNMMRTEDGEIVLIDFGAAKYQLDTQPVLSAAFLKPDYAAPEQYQTAKSGVPKDEGPWTDVYSLGATIFYLLTGQKPSDVNSRLSNKNTDLVFPKKNPVKIPKKWKKMIQKATELDSTKRIRSMQEFKEELMKVTGGLYEN